MACASIHLRAILRWLLIFYVTVSVIYASRRVGSLHSRQRVSNSTARANWRPTIDNSLLISKAFGDSMQPNNIIPYYYRAVGVFEKDDITITTLVTSNRFKVFRRLVREYKGPISVTVHATDDQDRYTFLSELHALYTSDHLFLQHVDVHLVLDKFERQLNLWRNVARFYARTDFVMMLDVDFALCTDFRSRVRSNAEIMGRLYQGNVALVIPAFEHSKQIAGTDADQFPKDKDALIKLVRKDEIGMFHRAWSPGHNGTDYNRFYSDLSGEIYRVNAYHHGYEPYVIMKREGVPWCDERFVGYGANKAACLFEIYLSGVSYYVLPNDFLIHQSHVYEEETRRTERTYNRKLHTDYREELCLRKAWSVPVNETLITIPLQIHHSILSSKLTAYSEGGKCTC